MTNKRYYKKPKSEKRLIFFSGAGLSQPSGISTFRDSDGLWENHNVEDICNEKTWKKNFELVHDFYNKRRTQLNEVEPNIAHNTIKEIIDKIGSENVYNLTQNVDDLFSRLDCPNTQLHGELTKMECTACGNIWEIGYKSFNITEDRCTKCNSLKGVKPHIVFFYGQAPNYSIMYDAFDHLYNKDTIVVIIGTMGNVVPIQHYIQNKPCKKILCNMEESPHINENDFEKASELLHEING